jgi:hypothetical protein
VSDPLIIHWETLATLALILTGGFICFWGSRFISATLVLGGIVLGFLLVDIFVSSTANVNLTTWPFYVLVAMVVTALLLWVYRVRDQLIGVILAATVFYFVYLIWTGSIAGPVALPQELNSSDIAFIVVAGIISLIGGFWLLDLTLVLGTAFVGAWIIAYGFDLLFWNVRVEGTLVDGVTTVKDYGWFFVIFWIVLGTIGFIRQYNHFLRVGRVQPV